MIRQLQRNGQRTHPHACDVPAGLEWTETNARERQIADAALRSRRFARTTLRPAALEIERRLEADPDFFPWRQVRAGGRAGWLSAAIPKPWGGGGLGIAEMAAAMEELCACDSGVANIFGAHALGLLPIMLCGDVALARRILIEASAGEARPHPLLCAFAITEPGGGSDVEEAEGLARGDIRSYATREGSGYRLHGRKVFISNGSIADYVLVFVALDRLDPQRSWTAFVVPKSAPGFTVVRVERKMGQRACPAAEIELENVYVPAADRVGAEGDGWRLSRRSLAVSRGPVGAIAVGIARDAFEAALEHRRQAPHVEPWVDDMLARMVVRIRSARAVYLEAALHCDETLLPSKAAQWLVDLAAGSSAGRHAVMALDRFLDAGAREGWARQCVLGAVAKVAGSDAAMAVTTEALDVIPPGSGPLRRRAEKAFRDAKVTQIYEGTNQINLRAIAAESWLRRLGG